MPTRLLPLVLLCCLCTGTGRLPAQTWPSATGSTTPTGATPRLASAEQEVRSMSPPEWGGEFSQLPPASPTEPRRWEPGQNEPVNAPRQIAEASRPSPSPGPSSVAQQAGSVRSDKLPGLTIGPELYPGQSPSNRINATQTNPTSSAVAPSPTPPHAPGKAVVWPSAIDRRAGEAGPIVRLAAQPQLPGQEVPGQEVPPANYQVPPAVGPVIAPPDNGQIRPAFPAGSPSSVLHSAQPSRPLAANANESPSAYFPQELGAPLPATPSQPFGPGFDPGFRTDGFQGNSLDWLENGQQFPHEAQQHYPPLSEILKTGRYFGSVEWQFIQPHFQNNTALVRSSPGSFSSEQFNWTYESAPQFRAGFESRYGPGVELDYWQFDHDSSSVSGISDGLTSFTSNLPEAAAGTFNTLSATAAGERLVAQQGLELHSVGLSFFKEMKLPISRLSGTFGLRYLSLAQQAAAVRLDPGGIETGRLEHITDFRGFGPRIRLDYLRPIGHTKLESIASFGSSLLFGNRDQFVSNSLAGEFTRTNADELVTTVEAAIGVQYVKHLGENRSAFVRLTYQSQTWLGAGTATDAAGDLGFRGLGITVGANR